jgi:hypothetical protein
VIPVKLAPCSRVFENAAYSGVSKNAMILTLCWIC